jgi:hypothetical protein
LQNPIIQADLLNGQKDPTSSPLQSKEESPKNAISPQKPPGIAQTKTMKRGSKGKVKKKHTTR